MRHKDPALMESIRQFVDRFYTSYERMPSLAEIAKEMKIGRTTAYSYLLDMNELGMLRYRDGEIATSLSDRYGPDSPRAAFFDQSIPCGPMETIEASVDQYIHLPASIFGSGEMYVIRTHGDSMIEAGIEPGDVIVIDRQKHARPGDIVVALTEEGNTLKRLGYDRETKRYYLHPENSTMYDIEVDELQIQGVVSFIIKESQNMATGRSKNPALINDPDETEVPDRPEHRRRTGSRTEEEWT